MVLDGDLYDFATTFPVEFVIFVPDDGDILGVPPTLGVVVVDEVLLFEMEEEVDTRGIEDSLGVAEGEGPLVLVDVVLGVSVVLLFIVVVLDVDSDLLVVVVVVVRDLVDADDFIYHK